MNQQRQIHGNKQERKPVKQVFRNSVNNIKIKRYKTYLRLLRGIASHHFTSMSSTSKMQQEATKPLNKSQTSMNKQLAQLANIAREITASLEESCSSIDENAQAAIEAYEEIQNSNRITKAHVKRAAKEARHTERIARKLLKQAFDKQQQSNKTLEKEDSCVDIGHTNDDTLDHHQTLKNDDTLYNNTPDEHTKMDDALNEEKQEDQVGFDNMSTSK